MTVLLLATTALSFMLKSLAYADRYMSPPLFLELKTLFIGLLVVVR
jgi:hypothetical protein